MSLDEVTDVEAMRSYQTRELLNRALELASQHAGDVATAIGQHIERAEQGHSRHDLGRRLAVVWHKSYEVLHVTIRERHSGAQRFSDGPPITLPELDSRVIGQNREAHFPTAARDRASDLYNQIVTEAIPGLEVVQSLECCEGPCDLPVGIARREPAVTWHPHSPSICERIGGRWVCWRCRNSLMLEGAESTGGEGGGDGQAEDERSKMNASLRFDILERDGFTCQSCGRTPNEDGVKLHVDHIVPIAAGGETEPKNLQALCVDCNLGKSDRRVEAMETA